MPTEASQQRHAQSQANERVELKFWAFKLYPSFSLLASQIEVFSKRIGVQITKKNLFSQAVNWRTYQNGILPACDRTMTSLKYVSKFWYSLLWSPVPSSHHTLDRPWNLTNNSETFKNSQKTLMELSFRKHTAWKPHNIPHTTGVFLKSFSPKKVLRKLQTL